ncbi:HlyD family efflux transporter periplasmic adaptor subunit [Wukongibacter baidiensis]|uniref:efflux RND transporter periplasmic adaptor subunit n=1 Tax=Wukongibacter baidiensis TaxID=1723361 RepID=UPI003D7F645D
MKRKKALKIVSLALVLMLLLGGGYRYYKSKNTVAAQNSMDFAEVKVTKGSIKKSISDSSVVESEKRQQVKFHKAGTIERVYIEEGQKVNKGDIILLLESGSENTSLEISKKNLEIEEKKLKDLESDLTNIKIYAENEGVITLANVKEGERIQENGVIGTVIDKDEMEVIVPFNLKSVEDMREGQKASVLLTDTFEIIEGYVTKISESSTALEGGGFAYSVTIAIENKGGLSPGMTTQVTVHTDSRDYKAAENVAVSEKEGEDVRTQISGKIKALYVEDGDHVEKGELIAVIDDTDILDDIESQKINVEQKQLDINDKIENLEDVAITSPITGTIISLDVADGDNVDMNDPVCVVADTEDLKVVLPVDELDVFNISKEQGAIITTDVFPGVEYRGKVEKIAMEGKSENGVSTFDVTIALSDVENLKLGMSIDVEVIIEEKENVLLLPVEAIRKRGKQSVVITGIEDTLEETMKNMKENSKVIETGLSTANYVEVINGLAEGDTVYYSKAISQNRSDNMRMPGMGMSIGKPSKNGGKRN